MSDIIRGGQFLVKETKCEDIFTPEDFNEEQVMMRDSVIEFVDKELWPNKERFEKKDYALTEEVMRKAGDLVYVKTYSTELNGGVIEGTFDVSRVKHSISPSSFYTELEVGGIVVNAYDLIAKIKKTTKTIKCNQVK